MAVVRIETVTRPSREASLVDLFLDGMVVWGHEHAGRNRPHIVNRPSRVFFRKDGKVTVRGANTITLSDFRVVSAWDKTGRPVAVTLSDRPTPVGYDDTSGTPRAIYNPTDLAEWAVTDPTIVNLLRADQKIPAIKEIRAVLNTSLLQAKNAVETPEARSLYPEGSYYR